MRRSLRLSAFSITLAAGFAPVPAQGPASPAVTPVVIRAARMLDLTSGQMLRDVSVVVTGDRITAVNPPALPAGARMMDLGDVTLLPGFIDLHTHLSGEISASSFIEPVLETSVDAAYKATRHARTTVMAGFTTVRDFGGEITVALGRAVDRQDVVGPRVVPSRNALGITGGHCDVTGFAPGVLEQGPKDGVADGPLRGPPATSKYARPAIRTTGNPAALRRGTGSGMHRLPNRALRSGRSKLPP
jgi:imidazolonepropionase-like amidohydrolase